MHQRNKAFLKSVRRYRPFRCIVWIVTVQAHLKLDVFLYAGAYKNRSFTAFDAREAYWNRRTQRYSTRPR